MKMLKITLGIAILFFLNSFVILFMVVGPNYLARAEGAKKSECRISDMYVGQRVVLNGTPLVVTMKDNLLNYAHHYWIQLSVIESEQ